MFVSKRIPTQEHSYFLMNDFILAESYLVISCFRTCNIILQEAPCRQVLNFTIFFTFTFICACLLPLRKQRVGKEDIALEVPVQVEVHNIPESLPEKKNPPCSL